MTDMTPWQLQALEVLTCNCAFGCPCQFNALPTEGHCRAGIGYLIERGRFGDTDLAGVSFAGLFAWPGPIHHGQWRGSPGRRRESQRGTAGRGRGDLPR